MPRIQRVLKAVDFDPEVHNAMLPLYATPKVDGIRFYIQDGVVWAASNKPIPNRHIQKFLPKFLPPGVDGEMLIGDYAHPDHFQRTMSAVMSDSNSIEGLNLFLFDYVPPDLDQIPTYSHRIHMLANLGLPPQVLIPICPLPPIVGGTLSGHSRQCIERFAIRNTILKPTAIRQLSHINLILQKYLKAGYEGIILRRPNGTYKFGRTTAAEALLLRIKPLADAEAVIVGFKELEHNDNEQTTSPLGTSSRSSEQDGKRPGGTLGGFIVRSLNRDQSTGISGCGLEFNVGNGPGLTQALRQEIWNNRETYLGSIIRYSYLKVGTKPGGKPRMPKFLGFRSEIDMDSSEE